MDKDEICRVLAEFFRSKSIMGTAEYTGKFVENQDGVGNRYYTFEATRSDTAPFQKIEKLIDNDFPNVEKTRELSQPDPQGPIQQLDIT